jgi:hypothetical protein
VAAQKFARFRRTFERRDRHTSVGGFQRPMPNGRRQAMIFRLRGVALFEGSVRGVPAERKRQERPDQLIVVGGLPRLLLRRLREQRKRRRLQRQAQACTLQIHRGRPSPSRFLKIYVGLKSLRALKTARSFSNRSFILEKLAPAFNLSCCSVPRSKVDRLG